MSIPAGIARMPIWRFSVLTAVGSAVWNLLFLWLGLQLGENWDAVSGWLGPVTYVVAALCVIALIWLMVRRRNALTA